ncbi:hypothetical protein KC19_3G248200 [Ceratodon purpureus]|uniref:Heterokaryon incompatibility domain-containing protein n=1 Tax=Ceratodon purpureus TaxID=3225 RepID=A0A8T0IP64_CERPU|nr:hypothetical protein KC19_3G248200 [Ceratodon purpureus]
MASQIHQREQAGFPLRVICIKETLESDGGICFGVPGNWDFHIISHTWTEDARNWSVEIANIMDERKSSDGLDAYAELFKQESFAGKRGYTDLLEFLSMLAADGVQGVWFDALCINQKDDGEKNREIARMSEYYARSRGCYVWCHGMGGGFRFWAEPGTSPRYFTLPRWFSRVWTLQEFVLPMKLAFIVGMDMAGCTAMFAYKGYCRSKRLSWEPAKLMDDLIKARFWRHFGSTRQVNSRELFPCPHCNHQQNGHVYFVEREEYFELMNRSSYKSIQVGRLPSNFWTEFKSPLYRLLTILSCSDQLRRLQLVALVVREISVRDCSEFHDEDRLLSILGLLQVDVGRVQLRTGRALHDQIYDVAQSLVNSPIDEHHRLLLLLCVAQYRGSPIRSMSWAPTFTIQKVLGDMWLQSLSVFHIFKCIAQVEELGKLGLALQCPFLQAKAVPFVEHRKQCSTCPQCRQAARIPHTNLFVLEVQKCDQYSVLLWAHSDVDHDDELRFLSVSPPTLTMSIKSDINVERLRTMSFHLYLLLIAEDQLPNSSQPYGLFLVCIGNDVANLHKVGVFIGGPGWDPETMEEAYDTPDAQSDDSDVMSEGEDGCFNNEELEDFQESQVVPWKDEFPTEDLDDDQELDNDEEENEDQDQDEEEEEGHENDNEVDAVNPKWEQDVQCMKWSRFTVGGFGEFVPSSIFSSDKIVE